MMKLFSTCLLLISIALIGTAARNSNNDNNSPKDQLTGAWIYTGNGEQQALLIMDNYITHTIYNKTGKQFMETRGGTYTATGNKLAVNCEFDTKQNQQVGKSLDWNYTIQNDLLTINSGGSSRTYQKAPTGTEPLAGLWTITGRMQEGTIVPIHRTGTRKTIKLLSGNRFQWAAIDPGKKEFMGTGGGTYLFENGQYTEHIEFFSRDSTRVGATLSFEGKLVNGQWHHSGRSSKGDNIYEIWSRAVNSQ